MRCILFTLVLLLSSCEKEKVEPVQAVPIPVQDYGPPVAISPAPGTSHWRPITFEWQPLQGQTEYNLQCTYNRPSDGAQVMLLNALVTGTSYTFTGTMASQLSGLQAQWKVRAINGPWNNPVTFTMQQ